MQKPTSLTVLGILNLVLAGLGILGGCYSVFSPILMKAANPAMAVIYTGKILMLTVVMALLGTISKGLMAGSGYGLIKGEAWGRNLGQAWAVISMALGLIFIVVNMVFIVPEVTDAMVKDLHTQTQRPGGAPVPQGMIDMMKMTLIVSTIGGGLVSALPYQITFLCMMNRKPVKAYFARRPEPASADNAPPDAPSSSASSPNPWQ